MGSAHCGECVQSYIITIYLIHVIYLRIVLVRFKRYYLLVRDAGHFVPLLTNVGRILTLHSSCSTHTCTLVEWLCIKIKA